MKLTAEKIEIQSDPTWFNPDRGLLLEPKLIVQKADTPGEAVRLGTKATVNATFFTYRSLQKIGSGQVSARYMSGPIGIVKMAIGAAREGPGTLLMLLTLIGANLAVINFLPIPVLDGGHMVFLIYEGIRRKPPDERVQVALTWIGLLLILTLMVFVVGLDLGWIARPTK
jgi:regulator of sigma E protease